ncbi:MAG: hypothetical protein V8S58_17715 [Lachnospiraceae bacterium]
MQEQVLHLETEQELDLEAWKLRLAELGYERMPQVDGMGQFSVRGGILDIYPLTEELPVRIELWDTEVDSIRTFDLESQRSIEQLDEIDIYPATEIVLTKKQAREGIERIRSEAKVFAEKLRAQQNTEEAYRISGIVKELTEGIGEGWKQTGLDAWISYFNKETVSFLDYS